MQTDKRILVALATVFVAAESYLLPFAKRQEYPEQPPRNRSQCQPPVIISCTAPLRENLLLSSGKHGLDYHLLWSRIDEICPIYESVASCIRSHASECEQQTRTEIERGLSVGDFLCSVQGRSLVRESLQSVCYTNRIQDLRSGGGYPVMHRGFSPRRSRTAKSLQPRETGSVLCSSSSH
ncbi:hypothetical protein BsWGS_23398 [Bradybaena similaris]